MKDFPHSPGSRKELYLLWIPFHWFWSAKQYWLISRVSNILCCWFSFLALRTAAHLPRHQSLPGHTLHSRESWSIRQSAAQLPSFQAQELLTHVPASWNSAAWRTDEAEKPFRHFVHEAALYLFAREPKVSKTSAPVPFSEEGVCKVTCHILSTPEGEAAGQQS